MKRYVISDIHLCDGGKSDEFLPNKPAMMKLLAGVPDGSLILNGDVLDLLRATLAEIEKAHGDLLDLLFKKTFIYVSGNHDREVLNFRDGMYRGVLIADQLIIGDVLFMHGDRFDAVNSEGKVIGNIATKTVDWMADHISPKVMTKAREFERWLRASGRFGSPAAYRDLAIRAINHFNCKGGTIRTVILGHTHQRDTAEKDGFHYINTGCWINGHQDVTEIDI